MPGKAISAVIVLCCLALGGWIGITVQGHSLLLILFAGGGIVIGATFVKLLRYWASLDGYRVVGASVGFLVGLLFAALLEFFVIRQLFEGDFERLIGAVFCFVGALMGMQLGSLKTREFRRTPPDTVEKPRTVGILDTSVIIDGRISDVCETGFLDGDIIIPQFVLKELQTIADSSEATKRTRGRRGLDILNKIKKQPFVKIIIEDTDYPSLKEVDQKLIQMAKETSYPILTNDFNLNKVAEVQSIQVLNINQLANSLKPIVLPGETMKVQVLKEGKEYAQGIAYLDDGTMVVVDNGRKFIGRTIEVTVTSVLQTTAGRMIFAVMRT
jgi:uncharacterized protein YacL